MHIEEFIPEGHDNAILMRDLLALTGLSNREARKYISEARKEGHIILNLQDGDGYFKPTKDEKDLVKRFIKQEDSRAKDVLTGLMTVRCWLDDAERGVFDAQEG